MCRAMFFVVMLLPQTEHSELIFDLGIVCEVLGAVDNCCCCCCTGEGNCEIFDRVGGGTEICCS